MKSRQKMRQQRLQEMHDKLDSEKQLVLSSDDLLTIWFFGYFYLKHHMFLTSGNNTCVVYAHYKQCVSGLKLTYSIELQCHSDGKSQS